MGVKFVIEHMEPDEQNSEEVPPWVQLEYRHMRTLLGPEADLYFTNLSPTSSRSLVKMFQDSSSLPLSGTFAFKDSFYKLMKKQDISTRKVCLLDPKATEVLSPEDANKFDWFLFGGILGDDPPRDRTAELRKLGFPSRNLGNMQMTTDTAVGVTMKVIHGKVKLEDIVFTDNPSIMLTAKETVEMPFRYMLDESGGPLMPPGMKKLLLADLNKSFVD